MTPPRETLKDLCNKVLELDKKATKGPYMVASYGFAGIFDIYDPDKHLAGQAPWPEANLFAHYRTACVKLAKAVLRYDEDMQTLANCLKEYEPKWAQFAKEARADVQKIVEGE